MSWYPSDPTAEEDSLAGSFAVPQGLAGSIRPSDRRPSRVARPRSAVSKRSGASSRKKKSTVGASESITSLHAGVKRVQPEDSGVIPQSLQYCVDKSGKAALPDAACPVLAAGGGTALVSPSAKSGPTSPVSSSSQKSGRKAKQAIPAPPYEALLWAGIWALAHDDGTNITKQLRLYSADPQALMTVPHMPGDWSRLAKMMESFGLQLRPLRFQSWVAQAQSVPDRERARERGCFKQWSKIVLDPSAYGYIRRRLGLRVAAVPDHAAKIRSTEVAREAVQHCVECALGWFDGQWAASAAEEFAPGFVQLGSMHLHVLPDALGPSCRELAARCNMLLRLPPVLPCSGLLRLYLSSNRLSEIPSSFFLSVPRLRRAYLDGNFLESLPASVGRLSDLEVLDASHNRLTSVPAELGRLRRLQELRLAGNCLETVPESLGKMPSLTVLDLSSNQLAERPFGGGPLATGKRPQLANNTLCGIDMPDGSVYMMVEARVQQAEQARRRQQQQQHQDRGVAKFQRMVRSLVAAFRMPARGGALGGALGSATPRSPGTNLVERLLDQISASRWTGPSPGFSAAPSPKSGDAHTEASPASVHSFVSPEASPVRLRSPRRGR
eukprot:TRINITY_DN19011_c0_g1_i1.p1 TRINITY_DN19011_c0_g1~~TRINITY_DN19011_c0_g1_i1.p1  ORF type:complete len:610 (+),score=84.78 TRINITY_DN19011_c0_g1_i1:114-1943(+)